MKYATRRAARVAARSGRAARRRRDAEGVSERRTTRRVMRARRVGLGAARDRSRARDRREAGGKGTRDGRARESRRSRAAEASARTLAGASSGAALRRGLVRVVMGDMSEEGVERAGVERERRSGASSVALEFKTPREPLTTFEMPAPGRFNPG